MKRRAVAELEKQPSMKVRVVIRLRQDAERIPSQTDSFLLCPTSCFQTTEPRSCDDPQPWLTLSATLTLPMAQRAARTSLGAAGTKAVVAGGRGKRIKARAIDE